jgi:hypothetical protein
MGAIFAMAKNREKCIFFIFILMIILTASASKTQLNSLLDNKPWTIYCFKTFSHSPGFSLSAVPDFSFLPQATGT